MNMEKLQSKTVTVQAGKMNAVAFEYPLEKLWSKILGQMTFG